MGICALDIQKVEKRVLEVTLHGLITRRCVCLQASWL